MPRALKLAVERRDTAGNQPKPQCIPAGCIPSPCAQLRVASASLRPLGCVFFGRYSDGVSAVEPRLVCLSIGYEAFGVKTSPRVL